MKIRQGLVSNSSSSSFLVVFPERPKTLKKVIELLFGDEKIFYNPYPDEKSPKGWPVELVADIVLNNIRNQRQSKVQVKTFLSRMSRYKSRWDSRAYENSYQHEISVGTPPLLGDFNESLRQTLEKEFSEKAFERLQEDFPGSTILLFSYSDNDGELYTAMEHGQLFKRLPHIRISNH